MTLKELQERFPDATEETWHHHPNGDGWVQNTALVSDTAYIGPDAMVYDYAQVHDNSIVRNDAKVFGGALVSDSAQIYGHAEIHGSAKVCQYAKVFGHAEVCDTAYVYGNAMVYGTAILRGNAKVHSDAVVYEGSWGGSPLYIQGSSYSFCIPAPGWIKIGCRVLSVEDWLEKGEEIARDYRLSAEKIEEYRKYVNLYIELSKSQ